MEMTTEVEFEGDQRVGNQRRETLQPGRQIVSTLLCHANRTGPQVNSGAHQWKEK